LRTWIRVGRDGKFRTDDGGNEIGRNVRVARGRGMLGLRGSARADSVSISLLLELLDFGSSILEL